MDTIGAWSFKGFEREHSIDYLNGQKRFVQGCDIHFCEASGVLADA